MTLDEFVKSTYKEEDYYLRPVIVCKDGFTMSVQASRTHYCTPRSNEQSFLEMEIGFPSDVEPKLLRYAEDKKNPTNTVYGYVPTTVIQRVIEKRGGIDVEKTFKENL